MDFKYHFFHICSKTGMCHVIEKISAPVYDDKCLFRYPSGPGLNGLLIRPHIEEIDSEVARETRFLSPYDPNLFQLLLEPLAEIQ